ncbi:hypothetical protein GQ602_003048 [Ophiocordyceps camponoti-floridani]|uniref:Uncharacterized protein n=1 Tax=Ophiocordyceps camponoti-floridani TaxID=2030778 RepID=A0A8H4Q7C7_9HYPO|nr:hypothetical protein GQ602_003048 [Ophiocordyceps camponoti-floridani]
MHEATQTDRQTNQTDVQTTQAVHSFRDSPAPLRRLTREGTGKRSGSGSGSRPGLAGSPRPKPRPSHAGPKASFYALALCSSGTVLIARSGSAGSSGVRARLSGAVFGSEASGWLMAIRLKMSGQS